MGPDLAVSPRRPFAGVLERIITLAGATNRTAPVMYPNPGPSNRPDDSEPEHIVHTIFGGDVTSATAVAGGAILARQGGSLAGNI